MDMLADPNSPYIHRDTLNNIHTDEKKFGEFVYLEFDKDAEYAALNPQYSRDLVHDAHQSYVWDVNRLEDNMKTSPDHFKICGYLAYWLRRNSPVIRWNETAPHHRIDEDTRKARELIFEFGRSFHAFMIGYRVCWFFERNKQAALPAARLLPAINGDYIRVVCYAMKYKNVSPHAMGLIYRSLFLGC